MQSKNIELFPFTKVNGVNLSKIQSEVVLPSYVDEFSYTRRLTSKTAIASLAPLTSGMEVDFDLITPNGHLEALYVEINLAETGGVAASTFLGYNIFDHIDVEVNGVLFKTIYPEQLAFLEKLNVNQLQFNRIRYAELTQANYQPIANTIHISSTSLFYLKMPIFTHEMPDLRWLSQPPLIRFYFKAPSSFVNSGSTSVAISYMNLIVKQFPTPLTNLSIDKTYRYINWNRYSTTMTLQNTTQYTVQLNTLMGDSAMLVFMLRSAPTYSNANNFLQLKNYFSSFELHDQSNNIIAIAESTYLNLNVMNRALSGDIFDSSSYPYIYTIIFSKNPDKIYTQVTGSYKFTSKENLVFTTAPTLSVGSYELLVYSADYNYYTFNRDGTFRFSR